MAAGHQHHLEFGGSPVGTEFDGRLRFRLVDRIPHLSLSHEFDESAARQIRYALVGTVGAERPFYHRYLYVVLDVRMVSGWTNEGGQFVAALRQRMQKIGGELYLVATESVPVPAGVPTFDTPEAAIDAAREQRTQRRAASLRQ